ncbi:type III secretion protein [Paraburkholderia sp. EG287B]|uniref:type III secretion protein n=1 Tax=unclassified Paraburkholderia TaxID=2615204 RepID=UPI0034D3917C
MYEQIEAHAAQFDSLRASLATPGLADIDGLRGALEATAREIGEAQGRTELDRDNLARLYRGFMAAARVIGHLQEQQIGAAR